MYPKSRKDLMWSCCGEDKRARSKKNPVLLRLNHGSDSTKITGKDCPYKADLYKGLLMICSFK